MPIDIPTLVTTQDRVYRSGDDIGVIYRRAAESRIRIERIAEDGSTESVAERTAAGDGTLHFEAALFGTGCYRVSMQDMNTQGILQRELWVLDRDAVPRIEVIGTSFAAGESIDLRWANAPGHRNDYVVLARVDGVAADEFDLPFAYVSALPHGRMLLDANNSEWGWPPAPGTYVVRLMKDDGYEVLAESAEFVIGSDN
jgi:hypothetical protein